MSHPRKTGCAVLCLLLAGGAVLGAGNAAVRPAAGRQILTAGRPGGTDNFPGYDTIRYDNGYLYFQQSYYSTFPGRALGVRFTPQAYPCRVMGWRACVHSQTTGSADATLLVNADGGGVPGLAVRSEPITVPPNQSPWNQVCERLLSTPYVVANGDFYMSAQQAAGNVIHWHYDTDGNTTQRAWRYVPAGDTGWVLFSSAAGDLNQIALVEYHDVGAAGITVPADGGTYARGDSITPEASITNYATDMAEGTVAVRFRIRDSSGADVWSDQKTASLGPGETKPVGFDTVTLDFAPGVYTAVCSTELADPCGDCRKANDRYSHNFRILSAGVEQGTGQEFGLIQARPNPFSGSTVIALTRRAGSVEIRDVCGRLVRTLDPGPGVGNRQVAVWDGTDASGLRLAPGLYYARPRGQHAATALRLILVR